MSDGGLPVSSRFKRFLGVGAIGFAVDALVFFVCLNGLGLPPVTARVIASSMAIIVTWGLNRRYTFRDRRARHQLTAFLRYGAASLAGAAANLAVLAVFSAHDGSYGHVPSYLAGTAAGLVMNFLLYDRVVFAKDRERS